MAVLDKTFLDQKNDRAMLDDPMEQYRAGLRYATGNGVPLDLVAAHKWFNLAALNGVKEARENRAEISMDMSPEEISAAQKQAREWVLGR
ncbi:SEL1-like repeat protein [Sneathiella chinensis]|uniref:Sel1 repeat family protein n=1 Tax=Sneathiella chinensis TaxID=349750 RepID=A0ABQ5U6M8_9PROT|nr:SEL1-like repeat protein [Sneathiella chinensis]GLQ07355.1 hypothetical protein GCM10007924_25760 [Sneathiella chinensis]